MPKYKCGLEIGSTTEVVSVDKKAYYLFGRDGQLAPDFVIDDPSVSRRHAAMVHHEDGRTFVIDLASVRMEILSSCCCLKFYLNCTTLSCMRSVCGFSWHPVIGYTELM